MSELLAWQGVFMFLVVAAAATILLVVHLHHRNKLAVARLNAVSTAEIKRMADELAALRNAVGEVQRLLREVAE